MEGAWYLRLFGYVIALKAPSFPPLFSERYRQGVRVAPLGFGWRITIRKIRPQTERAREIIVAIVATVIGVFLIVNLIRGFLWGAWNF